MELASVFTSPFVELAHARFMWQLTTKHRKPSGGNAHQRSWI